MEEELKQNTEENIEGADANAIWKEQQAQEQHAKREEYSHIKTMKSRGQLEADIKNKKNLKLTGLSPRSLFNTNTKKILWAVGILFVVWMCFSNQGKSSSEKDFEKPKEKPRLESAYDSNRRNELRQEAREATEDGIPNFNPPTASENATNQNGFIPSEQQQEMEQQTAQQLAMEREQQRIARENEARERAKRRLEEERAVFISPATTGNGNWGNVKGAEKKAEEPRQPQQYAASLNSGYNAEIAQRQTAAKAQEDRMNSILNRLGGGGNEQQQAQNDKMAFFNSTDSGRGTLKNTRQAPVSPYLIPCGTFIPCTLVSGVNSDLPGDVIASVTEDVYDWKNPNVVLIPQGTRVFGSYNSNVAWAQHRIQITWKRVVFPDGSTLELNGMAGVDKRGYSGLKDIQYAYYGRLITSAVMTAAFSSVGLLFDDTAITYVNGTTTNPRSEFAKEIGSSLGRMGEKLFSKNLDVSPTILIRQATRFNIMINADIPFYTGFRRK